MVRTRPKVCQASPTSQSGMCSLSEAVSPATEPSTSQRMAKAINMNTGKALERSASMRCASSRGSAACRASPGSAAAACRCARPASCSAGSSAWPISPRAKMTEAARGFSTSRPLRIDQMKTNSPMIDSRKAPSRLRMALSIGGFPFLFSGTRETRHFFDAVQMTAQRSVLGTAAADSKIHHGCMFFCSAQAPAEGGVTKGI